MKLTESLPRRRFLQISAAAAVSGNALLSCSRPGELWRSLRSEEALLVEAISEQVIPSDQNSGGKEAGVVNFIDLQLAGPHKRFRKIYKEGLARVNETSILLYQKPFIDLPFDRQTDLLAKLETDAGPRSIWQDQSSSEFFRLISDHCLQGYYGSPRHGGNQNLAGWRMLGVNYPQICGRNRGTG
jgi:gluconate 2-dehydrogenase gamma chain